MLRYKSVIVPFIGGLGQDVEPLLQAEGFTSLHWFAPEKQGSVSLLPSFQLLNLDDDENALGEDVPTDPTPAPDTRIVQLDDAYGYVRNGYLWVETDDAVIRQGRCSPWVVEQDVVTAIDQISTNTHGAFRHDSCVTGGLLFSAWEQTGGTLGYSVTDLATGATIRTGEFAGAGGITRPRLVPSVVAGQGSLYYVSATTDSIVRVSIDRTGPIAFSDDVIVSSFDPDASYVDYDVWGIGGTYEYIAWCEDDAGTVNAGFVASNGTLTSYSTSSVKDGAYRIAVASGSTSTSITIAWAGWSADESHSLYSAVLGASSRATAVVKALPAIAALYATNAFLVASIGAALDGAGQVFVSWFDPTGESAPTGNMTPATRGRWILNSDGSVLGGENFCARVAQVSKPWFDGTRMCLMAASSGGFSDRTGGYANRNRWFVVLGAEFAQTSRRMRPLAHFAAEYAEPSNVFPLDSATTGDLPPQLHCMRPAIESSTSVILTGLERDDGLQRFRLVRYRLVSQDDRCGLSAKLGGCQYIVGGLLTQWDGGQVREASFLQEPSIGDIADGAGSLAAGSRTYAVTWSRVNAKGELLRSRPSVLVTRSNNPSAASNLISIDPLSVTLQAASDVSAPRFEVWRTVDGQAEPLYMIHQAELDVNSSAIVTFDDTVTDASAPTIYGLSLYADGSANEELANDVAISPIAIEEWRDRLFITDGHQIQYTKLANLRRQAEFSLLQTLPKAAGPRIESILAVGQQLAVVTGKSVGIVHGYGPNDAGAGGTLEGPTVLQKTLGTDTPGAIGRIGSVGIVHTHSGLRLLTESGTMERLGDAVEDAVAASGLRWIRVDGDDSITLLHGSAAERFTMPDKAWSTLDVPGSCWAGDRVADGADIYGPDDTGSKVYSSTPTVVTPWFRAAGEEGEMRIKRAWLLGVNPEAAEDTNGLTVEVAYDYDEDTWYSVATVSAETFDPGPFEVRLTLNKQRCRSFRLRIRSTASAGAWSKQRLVALRLHLAKRNVAGALFSGDKAPSMVNS